MTPRKLKFIKIVSYSLFILGWIEFVLSAVFLKDVVITLVGFSTIIISLLVMLLSRRYEPYKKRKNSILEWIINRIKEKPATQKEIDQLKLNRDRALLKAEIAEAKSKERSFKRSFMKFLSALNSSTQNTNSSSTRKSKTGKKPKHESSKSSTQHIPSNKETNDLFYNNSKEKGKF